MMEDIKEIINSIGKNILSKKEVSKKEMDSSIKLLNSIKNDEQYQVIYNNLMGRILLKQNKYKEAKYYFENELKQIPNSSSAFYNLYKIEVYEKNYEVAISNINSCYNNSSKNTVEINFVSNILNTIIDVNNDFDKFLVTDYKIDITDKFLYKKISIPEVKDLYHEIIFNFNSKNYLLMKNNLIKFNSLVIKHNIKIEVYTVINMINNLIEVIKKKYYEKLVYYEQSSNYDNILIKFLIFGLEQQLITTKTFMNYIDRLISSNYKYAYDLLEYLTANYNLDNYSLELNYLKNKLNEKYLYYNLSKEKKDYYDLCIEKGRVFYRNGDLETAMYYYEAGLYVTSHPIFNYYIGKIYFKNKNFDIAQEYFSKYEQNGGEKELKALLYIWTYFDKHYNSKQIIKTDEKTKKLISFFDNLKDWNLIDYRRTFKNKYKDNDLDETKHYATKKIYITESYFQSKQLDPHDFESYSFKDKLILIRELYNSNNIILANKLLKDLENSSLNSQNRKQLTTLKKLIKK